LVPLSLAAIERAITLNGAGVEQNRRAFALGRWAVLHPEAASSMLRPKVAALPQTLEDRIAYRAAHLTAYQDAGLAARYRRMVDGIADQGIREAVATGYHKLLSYKDEYEVARLHLETVAKARAAFDGAFRPTFHLAPPFLPGREANGRPKKREFGPWMLTAFRILARWKHLRGTAWDPFGRTEERRMERALIAQYEADMAAVLPAVTPATRDAVIALAALPLSIRGFGPVKADNAAKAARRREELLAVIRAGDAPRAQAAE
ncbi:MAG: DUF6537 domain-containing protein, partial [Gemmobacter sp.]